MFPVVLSPTIYDLKKSTPTTAPVVEVKAASEPTPKPKPTARKKAANPPKNNPVAAQVSDARHYSVEEVKELIRYYSRVYNIDPSAPLCIAKLESGFNQFSKNKSSSASGVFQYMSGTWKGTDEGKAGLSVFDADANVRAAIKYLAIHKSTNPWIETAIHCPTLKFL